MRIASGSGEESPLGFRVSVFGVQVFSSPLEWGIVRERRIDAIGQWK